MKISQKDLSLFSQAGFEQLGATTFGRDDVRIEVQSRGLPYLVNERKASNLLEAIFLAGKMSVESKPLQKETLDLNELAPKLVDRAINLGQVDHQDEVRAVDLQGLLWVVNDVCEAGFSSDIANEDLYQDYEYFCDVTEKFVVARPGTDREMIEASCAYISHLEALRDRLEEELERERDSPLLDEFFGDIDEHDLRTRGDLPTYETVSDIIERFRSNVYKFE